jgi:hypothetical protein
VAMTLSSNGTLRVPVGDTNLAYSRTSTRQRSFADVETTGAGPRHPQNGTPPQWPGRRKECGSDDWAVADSVEGLWAPLSIASSVARRPYSGAVVTACGTALGSPTIEAAYSPASDEAGGLHP